MNEEYNEKEFEKAFQEAEELEQNRKFVETELAYSQYLAQDQQYHSYHSELAEYEKTLQTEYNDYYESERKRREQEDDDYWEEQQDEYDDYYESERKRREQEDDDYWEEQQRQQDYWDNAEFDAFCEQCERLEEDYSIAEMEALGLY